MKKIIVLLLIIAIFSPTTAYASFPHESNTLKWYGKGVSSTNGLGNGKILKYGSIYLHKINKNTNEKCPN